MGSKGGARVPYMKKVDSVALAEITNGACFVFGKNCNVFYNNGKVVGQVNYVGKPGPDMKFVVADKKDSKPGELDDKFVELFNWKNLPVPMME